MKVFFGGQIRDEYKGDLAAVVTRGERDELYSVFLYPILSDEFDHLTGLRSVHYPVERAYIGISHHCGNLEPIPLGLNTSSSFL